MLSHLLEAVSTWMKTSTLIDLSESIKFAVNVIWLDSKNFLTGPFEQTPRVSNLKRVRAGAYISNRAFTRVRANPIKIIKGSVEIDLC